MVAHRMRSAFDVQPLDCLISYLLFILLSIKFPYPSYAIGVIAFFHLVRE